MSTTSDYIEGLGQALFREAGDALFLFDPDTDQLLDVNPMAERLSGFPRQELLSRPATYYFRFAGNPGAQRLRQAAAHSRIFHAQDGFLMRTRQDGVWIQVNLTVARLHVRPKTLALITARDMRAQFESHQKVQKAEQDLRRVLTSVSDCLWSAEIDRTGRWVYRYISPVVARIMGRPAEHFLPDIARWRDVVHADDLPRWEKARASLRQHPAAPAQPGAQPPAPAQPLQLEYRVLWPDGSVHWVRDSITANQRAATGNLGLDGVLSDITERKRAE